MEILSISLCSSNKQVLDEVRIECDQYSFCNFRHVELQKIKIFNNIIQIFNEQNRFKTFRKETF